jgi:hypothetical protein
MRSKSTFRPGVLQTYLLRNVPTDCAHHWFWAAYSLSATEIRPIGPKGRFGVAPSLLEHGVTSGRPFFPEGPRGRIAQEHYPALWRALRRAVAPLRVPTIEFGCQCRERMLALILG